MSPQRGMVLLLSMVLTLLVGLFASVGMREALTQTAMAGHLQLAAQAFEDAEATLLEGAAQWALVPREPCSFCGPAKLSQVPDDAWQQGARGFFLLQNLGQGRRVRSMPEEAQMTLFRVTAVSRQGRLRHVLEAVYAVPVDGAAVPQRILWRQRS